MKTLKETACGQTVKVKRLHGEGPVKADAEMIEVEA